MQLFFDMKRHNLINECLVVLPDLMRRLPLSLPDFIGLLPSEPPSDLSGPALASYAWILGEYGDRIADSVYCLEFLMLRSWGGSAETKAVASSALPSAHDEQSMMKICLITSLAKLLFVSPAEVRPVLAQALSLGVRDGHPAVRAKATFLYNQLKTNLDTARAALLSTKSSMEPFVEDADAENIDMVFDEFNTFSVIYEKPQIDWSKPQEQVTIEAEEDEGEDENVKRLEYFQEISAEDFQALWTAEDIAAIEDSISLGFDLDLEPFLDALASANIGFMA
jgi:hypothetical protein